MSVNPRSRTRWPTPAAVLACLLIPACLTLSPAQEIALGRKEAAKVAAGMGLVDDPEVRGIVEAVGRKLVRALPPSPYSFEFHVVHMEEPNAFALPGGFVYVSRGLLALVNREDELAGVLGHEIGHVVARHAATRIARAQGVGLATVLGAVAAAAVGGSAAANAVGSLGQVAGAGYLAAYSRDQERESDEIGQELAARAGYDPAALIDFFVTLEAATRLLHGERNPSFFDSHPSTPERIARARARAGGLRRAPPSPVAPDRAAFLAHFEGLLVGPDPAEGVVTDATFLHPDLDFHLRFPPGFAVQNTRAAVGAAPSTRDALVVLSAEAEATDARAAAEAFARELGVSFDRSGPVVLGGSPGWRGELVAATDRGTLRLDVTFVEHGGTVLRLLAAAPPASFARYAPAFEATRQSFRRLRRAERDRIRELRLRVVRARAGERLEALAARHDNAWELDFLAVANALPRGALLEAGEPVKIAVARPYRGRSRVR